MYVNAAYPNICACVTVHDLEGHQLARPGGAHPARDRGSTRRRMVWPSTRGGTSTWARSRGAGYGRRLDPPRLVRCFRKLVRV